MISVTNIVKTFKLYQTPADRLKEIILRRGCHKEFKALKNINFSVQEGQTLGIIGPNGAGKSTLLKIMAGILIPDEGAVNINGKVTGLLELGTGFNEEFSGLDNIFLNGTYLGLSRSEINKRVDQIIEFTELGDFINEPMKTYSSGMIMRLAFATAIHADPQAFVVDEALSVGDAYFQQKCMARIKEFKKNGGSIVFVSHDMNSVKILCDKVILLENGEIVEEGEPESVINSYNFLVAKRSNGEEISYIGNKKSSGYGNNKVTIDTVTLLDENANNATILKSGNSAKIKLAVTVHESVKDLSIGILIRDKFGQDIFGTNSFHLKKELKIKQGQTYLVTYQFDEFNIGPGKYTIIVAAHTGDTHIYECYHWVDRALSFEIIPADEFVFAGLNRLVPELFIENG